jgi:outer membrane protein OmpA-like peptidoglycan-associated protein
VPAPAWIAAVLAGALAAPPRPIDAQPTERGLSAERLRVVVDRAGLLDVEAGHVAPHAAVDAVFWLHLARDPLVFTRASDGERLGPLVARRLGGGVGLSLALFDRVSLAVEVPFIVDQSGPRTIDGVTDGARLPALTGSSVGDVALVPKLALLTRAQVGVDVAVLAWITLPTARGVDYLGERTPTVSPEVAISRGLGGWWFGGNLALTLRGTTQVYDQVAEHELRARAGVAYRFDGGGPRVGAGGAGGAEVSDRGPPLELGATIDLATALAAPFERANQRAIELKAQIAYTFAEVLTPFIGAGVGLSPGWGAPDVRFFAGLRFAGLGARAAPAPPTDADADGVPDASDACVNDPETKNGLDDADGCPDAVDPDPDRDGVLGAADLCPDVAETRNGVDDDDGCPDLARDTDGDGLDDPLDACPVDPEDRDRFEDDDGCPDPDNDQDGVLDVADACGAEPGVAANRGCPDPDGDGDGVPDRLDNCPRAPGTAANQGCQAKQLAVLRADRIEIMEAVYFAENRDLIEARSHALLDNVARILVEQPRIRRLRVEGHTDDRGADDRNLGLSQRRALAVVRYLVGRGVARERLDAVGLGENRPVADNRTAAGRAKNRRVEFNIVDDAATDGGSR